MDRLSDDYRRRFEILNGDFGVEIYWIGAYRLSLASMPGSGCHEMTCEASTAEGDRWTSLSTPKARVSPLDRKTELSQDDVPTLSSVVNPDLVTIPNIAIRYKSM